MKTILSAVVALLANFSSIAQESRFVLIQSVGDGKGENPIMEIVPDSSAIFKAANNAITKSFMGQAIELFHIVQNYMINTGQLEEREPAYLAITKNEGGFARKGFQLKTESGIQIKKNAHYVDLTAGHLTSPIGQLMSVTQLYPHELGHAMYRMLSSTDSIEQEGKSVTVHYFSLVTDNSIAFNEGFAEHIENIARLFEVNDSIKLGIENDVSERGPHLISAAEAFIRDFTWPFRLNYYKASMVIWFQQFEDYKRYKHSLAGTPVYKNFYPELNNVADMISVRNAGVEYLEKRRNKPELMASEGFVSSFFSRLAVNGLGKKYQQPDFYKKFLNDTSLAVNNPAEVFNEIENLFAKYFYVLNRHVVFEKTEKAQLMDFIEGYVLEFPEERESVYSTYLELTGESYSSEIPPQLWMMSREYNHRILALDAFGAVTLPVYTFNVNSADAIDLQTVNGVDKESAKKIIDHREEQGYFQNVEEIFQVPGVSESAIAGLRASEFDESILEGLDLESIDIGILLKVPILNLFKRSGLAFLFIFLISFLIALRKHTTGFKIILTTLKYYVFWLLLVISGLAAVIIQGNPVMMYLVVAAVYFLIGFLILRNKPVNLKHFVINGCLMHLLVIYSLI